MKHSQYTSITLIVGGVEVERVGIIHFQQIGTEVGITAIHMYNGDTEELVDITAALTEQEIEEIADDLSLGSEGSEDYEERG